MEKLHFFKAEISWKGNLGNGTLDYKAYSRNHDISIQGKPALPASSDAAFRGDPTRHTPEDLLVSSLSGCHMLWYLHLCSTQGVVVTDYHDRALGEMVENGDGSGQFAKVTLNPRVTVTEPGMIDKARRLHDDAHKMCFIARSVNFPLYHSPEITCYEKA